jgi:hypothetical protein
MRPVIIVVVGRAGGGVAYALGAGVPDGQSVCNFLT